MKNITMTKRLFSLVLALLMVFSMMPQITLGAAAEETTEDIYTVVGVAGLCGSAQDPNDTANDMTKGGPNWSKTYTGIAKGNYGFKVVRNRTEDCASATAKVPYTKATVTIYYNGSEAFATYTCEHGGAFNNRSQTSTCTTPGTSWKLCDDCNAAVETTELPLAKHTYSDNVCTACGAIDPESPAPEIGSDKFNSNTIVAEFSCGARACLMGPNDDACSFGTPYLKDNAWTCDITVDLTGKGGYYENRLDNAHSGYTHTAPADMPETVTVTATWDAENEEWTVKSYPVESKAYPTYTFTCTEPQPENVTVYAINSMRWDTVCAYVWDVNSYVAWPGAAMTKTGETVNGFDVYSYTFPETCVNIIFNNNAGSQTADMTVKAGQYYDIKGREWYASLSDVPYVDPLSTGVYLLGEFNGWSAVQNEFKKAEASDTAAQVTLELAAETTYEFKIINNGAWTSTSTAITGDASGVSFSSSVADNAKITTKAAGEYVFTYDLTANTMSVSYPEASTEPEAPAEPAGNQYALCGFINGANYGIDGDAQNIGEYIFVDGKLTVTFTSNSYVMVKTTDNATWYMTDGWAGEATSVTLYDTALMHTQADKLMVPVGVELTFTLVENADGTLTLSYSDGSEDEEPTDPAYETRTIYFQNNWLWSDVNIYFWGSETAENPAWPGIAMELAGNDGTYDIYKYEVPADVKGFLFNGLKDDGSGTRDKSPDIEEGFYNGICYYMLWDNGNAVGSEDIRVILPGTEVKPDPTPDPEPTPDPGFVVYFDPNGVEYDLPAYRLTKCDHNDWDDKYQTLTWDNEKNLWVSVDLSRYLNCDCVRFIEFFDDYHSPDRLLVSGVLEKGKTYVGPAGEHFIVYFDPNGVEYDDITADVPDCQHEEHHRHTATWDEELALWVVDDFDDWKPTCDCERMVTFYTGDGWGNGDWILKEKLENGKTYVGPADPDAFIIYFDPNGVEYPAGAFSRCDLTMCEHTDGYRAFGMVYDEESGLYVSGDLAAKGYICGCEGIEVMFYPNYGNSVVVLQAPLEKDKVYVGPAPTEPEPADYVLQVGDEKFEASQLKDAFTAANNGGTVEVLKDFTLSEFAQVAYVDDVTLNLNGYTITLANSLSAASSTVTINAGNGGMAATDINNYLAIGDKSNVVLNGGTYGKIQVNGTVELHGTHMEAGAFLAESTGKFYEGASLGQNAWTYYSLNGAFGGAATFILEEGCEWVAVGANYVLTKTAVAPTISANDVQKAFSVHLLSDCNHLTSKHSDFVQLGEVTENDGVYTCVVTIKAKDFAEYNIGDFDFLDPECAPHSADPENPETIEVTLTWDAENQEWTAAEEDQHIFVYILCTDNSPQPTDPETITIYFNDYRADYLEYDYHSIMRDKNDSVELEFVDENGYLQKVYENGEQLSEYVWKFVVDAADLEACTTLDFHTTSSGYATFMVACPEEDSMILSYDIDAEDYIWTRYADDIYPRPDGTTEPEETIIVYFDSGDAGWTDVMAMYARSMDETPAVNEMNLLEDGRWYIQIPADSKLIKFGGIVEGEQQDTDIFEVKAGRIYYADGTFEDNAVASIGDETFNTLEAALKAAESGDVIKLLSDDCSNETDIPEGAVLDLNGHKLAITGTPFTGRISFNGGSVVPAALPTMEMLGPNGMLMKTTDGIIDLAKQGMTLVGGTYTLGATGVAVTVAGTAKLIVPDDNVNVVSCILNSTDASIVGPADMDVVTELAGYTVVYVNGTYTLALSDEVVKIYIIYSGEPVIPGLTAADNDNLYYVEVTAGEDLVLTMPEAKGIFVLEANNYEDDSYTVTNSKADGTVTMPWEVISDEGVEYLGLFHYPNKVTTNLNGGSLSDETLSWFCDYGGELAEDGKSTTEYYQTSSWIILEDAVEWNAFVKEGSTLIGFRLNGGTEIVDRFECVDGLVVDLVWQTDYVAKIGDTEYDSLQDALDAAQEGDSIKLFSDDEVDALILVKGITLDLNGYTVDVENYAAIYDGNHIVDSVGGGLLKGQRIMIDDGNKALPIWDAANGGYAMAKKPKFNEAEVNETNGVTYHFLPELTPAEYKLIAQGAEVSGVTMKVKVSWTKLDAQGNEIPAAVTFTYTDALMKQFADNIEGDGTFGKNFKLSLTGTKDKELTFQVYFESDTGVIFPCN